MVLRKFHSIQYHCHARSSRRLNEKKIFFQCCHLFHMKISMKAYTRTNTTSMPSIRIQCSQRCTPTNGFVLTMQNALNCCCCCSMRLCICVHKRNIRLSWFYFVLICIVSLYASHSFYARSYSTNHTLFHRNTNHFFHVGNPSYDDSPL